MTCGPTSSRHSRHWHNAVSIRRPFYGLHWGYRQIETEGPVATPNYGYEKRQKELAKKRKKEDKLKAKAERKVGGAGEGDAVPEEPATSEQPPAPEQR